MEIKNVLIIEEDKKTADFLKTGLSEQAFHIEVAYDGKIALQIFSNKIFDLVILDTHLQGLNGYDLCKAIRRKNEEVPVILLASMNSLSDKICGYEAGADDYIAKPFELKELRLKACVLLKRLVSQNKVPENILKAADLVMNLDSGEVQRGGKRIKLTAKEFQLLEYLLRNKNRVISRMDLAMNVWDINFSTNTNVIDVYISYIRSKVDRGFDQKLILTHVGMGYILKENF